MIILDTSFLIALKNSADADFKRAEEIQESLYDNRYGPVIISEYIFDEFVTFLRNRLKDKSKAITVGEELLNSNLTTFVEVSSSDFTKAWELFKKYEHLSFTDATTVILCEKLDAKYVCSFDSDFDGFKNIQRIH